jgi:hypothetical protein
MKGIPKPIGCGIAISFFTIMLTTSMTHRVIATSDTPVDPSFGPGNPRFDAAMDLLTPDEPFPQFDPENPTAEVILPQETKEYTNVYWECTDDLTTEKEQPCNRLMLYLAGECENDDTWLFCDEELDNYLRNHDLEGEEFLKQTDIYEDYKSLNRLAVEQMADMPFEEMVARLEANQTR